MRDRERVGLARLKGSHLPAASAVSPSITIISSSSSSASCNYYRWPDSCSSSIKNKTKHKKHGSLVKNRIANLKIKKERKKGRKKLQELPSHSRCLLEGKRKKKKQRALVQEPSEGLECSCLHTRFFNFASSELHASQAAPASSPCGIFLLLRSPASSLVRARPPLFSSTSLSLYLPLCLLTTPTRAGGGGGMYARHVRLLLQGAHAPPWRILLPDACVCASERIVRRALLDWVQCQRSEKNCVFQTVLLHENELLRFLKFGCFVKFRTSLFYYVGLGY